MSREDLSVAADPCAAPDTHLLAERAVLSDEVGARSSVAPAERVILGERRHAGVEPSHLAMPAVLGPASADVAERWFLPAPPPQGVAAVDFSLGCVSGRRVGPWLHATAVLDDRTASGGLKGAAETVYRDLFAVLEQESRACGTDLQVLKVWNYMADINGTDEETGLERYRLFNIGRQDAFVATGHAAFDGAPAACALGTVQGPLTVHLLAGPHAPRTVENPRQVSAYRYPADYGPRAPTFSRAALADLGDGLEALFISGTASIVGHESRHPGDVQAQTEETLNNIEAVLAAAQDHRRALHHLGDLELTVYLRRPEDLDTVRRTLARRLGDPQAPALARALFLRADVCRAELLVEIEAQSLQIESTAHRHVCNV